MDEKEAIAKLKELGYDTTNIEKAAENKSADVVPIDKSSDKNS